jgi:hypothetical protein
VLRFYTGLKHCSIPQWVNLHSFSKPIQCFTLIELSCRTSKDSEQLKFAIVTFGIVEGELITMLDFNSSLMLSPFISASPSTVQHFHHQALKSSTLPRPFSSSSHPSQHFTPLFYPFFPIHIRSNTHTQKVTTRSTNA